MRRRAILMGLFVALWIAGSATAIEPADPDLIPEARAVLNYLESVYGNKVISGMASYGGWRPVYEVCGKAPAVYSNDAFGWNKPKWGAIYSKVLQGSIDSTRLWWEDKGGIPAMQFHWGKPGDPNGSAWVSGGGGKGTGPVDMAKSTTPGTPEHAAAMEDLRQTADYLEQLAKARVPVLWRPLHEIDGGWFWWTDAKQPENTAKMWQIMFDYFVKERKLHNLIWVYSAGVHAAGLKPAVSPADEIAFRKRFYPGDPYVDIAGIDVYPAKTWGYDAPASDSYGKAYDLMKQVAPGKIIALTECAAIPNPDQLQKDGPGWLYALPWFTLDRSNPPEWIRKTFLHERIVTLDELPALGKHNIAPDVRLLEPADSAEIADGDVELKAWAQDRNGNLKNLEFYALPAPPKNWFLRDDEDTEKEMANAVRLGEAKSEANGRFSFIYSNPSAGFYNIAAVARDSEGKASCSNFARVSVGIKNLARGGAVSASSNPDSAARAVDGDLFTSWNGDKQGEQWLVVDLGAEQFVGGVVVAWWKAYAKAFQIEISSDGRQWKSVYRTDKRTGYHGDSDFIHFTPLKARHVRLLCTQPGTNWGGYTVYELQVFASPPESQK